MKDFKQLDFWIKAQALALEIYKATKALPADERFGLTQQLRRSAVSITSNIAEGCGRGGDADFNRCLQIGFGPACESESQLLLARDLGYLDGATFNAVEELLVEVKKMLAALIVKIRADIAARAKS